ncbi:phage portal protein [Glutamicibacter ardleyensis]|uniref:Phage portal protein n=1 Tax=Glutamicibacter ardleyensis TaxID=225894 RepID=A0ABQ2DIY5_9MICC|nr:phage portal protein [Glutamicibacter ardleyensis]GGJ58897.1 hypothetical protein GCM10007173_17000 [Glutamicibacter ardleyensis]
MPLAIDRVNSPGWWLAKAFAKREDRLDRLDDLNAWHIGEPPTPAAVREAREAFREFEAEATTNWAELIVGSMRERQAVRDVRTSVSGDDPDDVAWKYWLDNNLDVEFSTFVETFLWAGDAYAMIIDDEDGPLVTHEDPRECVTFHDPVRQSQLRAAAKFYSDPDEDRAYAVVMVAGSYYDDGLARTYTASMDGEGELATSFDPESWSWDEDSGGVNGMALKHGLVPVVRLRNRRGMGEFEPHLPHMRRINRLTFQLSVIVMYQAYKQRAIISDVDDPEDAAQEELAEAFNADSLEDVLTSDPGSWFMLPSGTKVWESTPTDIQGLLKALHDEQLALAAVARRPMGMFAPDNQSASGANFTREGLQFAVEDKQARLRRFLVDVFHLVFLTADDSERAEKSGINVSFMPAERYTITDKASATSQVSQKFPLRTILREIWQMTPTQIQQVEAEADTEALMLGEFAEYQGAGNEPRTPAIES